MYINWQTYDVLLLNPSLLCFDCHTTITHAYQINRDNIETTNMTTSKCLQNLSNQIPIANDANKSTPIILACHVSSLPSSRLCNNFLSPAASHKPKAKQTKIIKKQLKCQNQNKQTKNREFELITVQITQHYRHHRQQTSSEIKYSAIVLLLNKTCIQTHTKTNQLNTSN